MSLTHPTDGEKRSLVKQSLVKRSLVRELDPRTMNS